MKDKSKQPAQNRSIREYYSIIVKIFITLTVIDFSGDFLMGQRGEINLYQAIEDLIRVGIMASLIVIGILGTLNALSIQRIKYIGLFCLFSILLILIYALVYGVFENNLTNAIRESLPAIALLLIPLLISMDKMQHRKLAIYFIYLLVIVAAVKIVVAQLLSITIYGSISWKVLLRLSPLLILPYCYFLATILKGKATRSDFVFLLIVAVAILMANARALNLLLLIATIFIVFTSKISARLLLVICIIALSAYLSIVATDGSMQNVFGIWSGEHLENTIDHRRIQLEILLDRFLEKPIFGFGFGYFTPGYDTYADLTLPYLLELDLINFFTKIGIPLSLLYVFSYILFVFQHIKNRVQNSNIEFSYLFSLILLLIYSLFQTAHSGFTFWIFYAMTFSFLFRKS
jgi:hypothetical protein